MKIHGPPPDPKLARSMAALEGKLQEREDKACAAAQAVAAKEREEIERKRSLVSKFFLRIRTRRRKFRPIQRP